MTDVQQTDGSSIATGGARDVAALPEADQPTEAHDWGSLDLPGFSDEGDDFDDASLEAAPKRPWWRRPWVLITAAAIVVLAAVLTPIMISRARGQPITYTTATVQQGNLITTVSATGPLQGATYDVNFSGSGLISEIDVSVGQKVTAGQVLAKLDPTSLQDAVNAAETALNNAYNSRGNTDAQASAQLNAAYQQEQNTILNTCDPMTDSTKQASCIANAQAQYASAQAQAYASESSANAQVSTAQANLTTAQDNLGNATLKAPHAGIVGAVNGKVGGTPGAGGSSGSGSSSSGAFIEIVDLSSMQVVADVNEADIGKIAVGETVTFTVSAYSTHTFRGTVATISPLGQTSSNVVTYPVTINVDAASLQTPGVTLLPAMTANATITTARRVGVLLVPATAITFARSEISSGAISRTDALNVFRQAAQMLQSAQSSDTTATADNLQATFVLERSNNKWVVKPIVIGLTNGTAYEVLAGLNAGDTLVTGQSGGASSTTSSTTTGGGLFGGGGGRFGGGGTGGGRNGGGGTTGGGTNGGGTNGGSTGGNSTGN
jgi:multidrug efflux pump subunit AcrA (membrane-fusion protein)